LYRLTERNRAIAAMFASIAPKYDLLNRLLSLGADRRWRRAAVASMVPAAEGRHLDLATGTADMALEIVRQKGDGAAVAAVDLSLEMLRLGREKCRKAGAQERIALLQAPGENLPFRDCVFDSACVAFGIRNVADRARGLREMCRVVRRGGRVVILEFSTPRSALFGALYRFYFTTILPRIGGWFSRRSAYDYLPESVLAFPQPEEFAGMMREAGCSSVSATPLSFGIVTLYVGQR
jgi:demethylmenaquinone methyltransferase / 2-methoxy-6-polyprenyl-1,4-benzoquinol methylase